ncbi:MAG: hypothetical protein SGJ11_17235 [Phycisphaerae bacterium]|nr:hypothetical protein [Phycisphaerae bacterium]
MLRRPAFAKELELLQEHILWRRKRLTPAVRHLDTTHSAEPGVVVRRSPRDDDVRLQPRGYMDDIEHPATTGGIYGRLGTDVPLVANEGTREERGLALIHPHHDVDVVRKTRLAEHG